MITRTIMIFPEFHNMEVINFYRNKYDPLSDLVKPHITLVFPFQSGISNDELNSHLDSQLINIKPFEITLQGVSRHPGESGNYLFLNVVKGTESIRLIHDKLYSGALKEFFNGDPYCPHLTLGNTASIKELENAYLDASACSETFKATVNIISTEMIGRSGESIIISEYKLPD
ncbi:2'-5' RNA ligase family protein [Lacrimispora indolis]|uniref:2'-5' RNA ligase family protein n=1 Tax=Lacrimispora indolis TaxID=69825 RepID=UPI0004A3F6D3|nr:2'-5' RNA ligase family protein [Lacrimispora indolis]